jgi:anti-sigma-K factor RskA
MGLDNNDPDITRRYLLGQLTDEEQQVIEERLLREDELAEELEATKDELTQEYVNGQLNTKEVEWLQNNFLLSPEGKQRHEFARTFNRYAQNHRSAVQKKPSWIERFVALWTNQPNLIRISAAVAVLVMAVVVFLLVRTPSPPTVATLTLTNSSSTRSTNTESAPKVRLTEDVLKLIFILPSPGSPGVRYRVELLKTDGETRALEVPAQEAQSISVEIPAAQLRRGQYAATLTAIDARGGVERIPGNYYFTIE